MIITDEESAYRGTVVGTGSFHVEFLRLIYISVFFYMLSLLSIFILSSTFFLSLAPDPAPAPRDGSAFLKCLHSRVPAVLDFAFALPRF